MLIKDTQDLVARARALAPMVEAAADRTEKERKIPADVLSAMHACGLFHMLLPVSLGGGAVDLVTFNQVVEAVAVADASPAWCLAQAAASSHAAGFLDPKVAREVFGRGVNDDHLPSGRSRSSRPGPRLNRRRSVGAGICYRSGWQTRPPVEAGDRGDDADAQLRLGRRGAAAGRAADLTWAGVARAPTS